MILTGVVTLGRNVELKYTQSGTPVASINGAYNIGFGQNKETQWVRLALFGKQAEALAQYLTKGTKADITAKDVKVNTYQKQDGTQGVSLEAVVVNIDLVGGGQSNGQNQGQQAPQQQRQSGFQGGQNAGQNQQAMQAQAPQYAPNDFDDDVPW